MYLNEHFSVVTLMNNKAQTLLFASNETDTWTNIQQLLK